MTTNATYINTTAMLDMSVTMMGMMCMCSRRSRV